MKTLREITTEKDNAIHASIHDEGMDSYYPDNLEEGYSEINPSNHKHNDLHERLSKHYNSYTKSQQHHLKDYTDDSEGLNDYHWKKHKKEAISSGENAYMPEERIKDFNFKLQTHYVDESLKQHKTPEAMTVYSGIKYDPRERMNSKHIVKHPAYLSTSIEEHVANGFGELRQEKPIHQHVLKIDVPKGHSGAYVGHIGEVPEEREFIMKKGTKLRHIGHSETSFVSPYKENVTRHTHHMEIVK